MNIIATTADGYLISATAAEVTAILTATTGTAPKEVKVGQKLPAIDYASTITKIKALKADYDFNNLLTHMAGLTRTFAAFSAVVDAAADIEA